MVLRALSLTLLSILLLCCASRPFEHYTIDSVPFTDRALSREADNVRVSVAVPGAEETERLFGVALYERGIQPVWIEIANANPVQLRYAPVGTDPDYYSPLEVAYALRSGFSTSARRDMERYFHDIAMPRRIPARTTRSGFVFTHLRKGTKEVMVDLYGNRRDVHLAFFVEVPGLEPDHADLDLDQVYEPQEVLDLDITGLYEYLRTLNCCAVDATGELSGNPVNIAFVGAGTDVLAALLRAGWNETLRPRDDADRERRDAGETLFGRSADAVFRRTRGDQDRNELRVWLAPRTIDGERLWLAQSTHHMSHKGRAVLDPDVDDSRAHTLQSMWYAQTIEHYAFVKGPENVPIETGRQGIGGEFFTDGYRVVLWLSPEPVSMLETAHVRMDDPPADR